MSRAPWNNVLHPAAGAAERPLVIASAAAALRRLQFELYRERVVMKSQMEKMYEKTSQYSENLENRAY